MGRYILPEEKKKKKKAIAYSPWFLKILENCGMGYRKFIEEEMYGYYKKKESKQFDIEGFIGWELLNVKMEKSDRKLLLNKIMTVLRDEFNIK